MDRESVISLQTSMHKMHVLRGYLVIYTMPLTISDKFPLLICMCCWFVVRIG